MINITDIEISEDEQAILEKGLDYIPTWQLDSKHFINLMADVCSDAKYDKLVTECKVALIKFEEGKKYIWGNNNPSITLPSFFNPALKIFVM